MRPEGRRTAALKWSCRATSSANRSAASVPAGNGERRFAVKDTASGDHRHAWSRPIHQGDDYDLPVPRPLWNDAELLSARQTEHTKVAPVQSEHGLNSLPICQMYQARVGKLYPQALILSENRGDSGKVRFFQRNKLKRLLWRASHTERRICRGRNYRFWQSVA